MTTKDAFAPDEWDLVLEAPTSAGMIVLTASHGGTFRETFAMSKAYAEARSEHGKSELLDEIVGSKPHMDHTHYHSPDELKTAGLKRVQDAVTLLEGKSTTDEVEDYKRFVITLAHKVASAHKEKGQAESEAELKAIETIEAALSSPG
ncbi:MAG: hypothetical protein ACJ735_11995 [Actinomycetes bacterium]